MEPTILLLIGPPGDNPLGFLSVLGTLRGLNVCRPQWQPRIDWCLQSGGWRARLHLSESIESATVVTALDEWCRERAASDDYQQLGDDLPMPASRFQQHQRTLIDHANRVSLEFMTALGSDMPIDEAGEMGETEWRALGGGQTTCLGDMRKIAVATSAEQIHQSLFALWIYADGRPSMRLDPNDDRRYALRAGNPSDTSKSPLRTMRGANRLAVEGWCAFPTMPTQAEVRTQGFRRVRRQGIRVRWPVWNVPLSWRAITTVMGHPEIWAKRVSPLSRQRLGIAAIFESLRFGGYYRNFTLGEPK